MTGDDSAASPIRRYIAATTIPLVVLLIGSVLWAALIADSVPDPMAQHFSGDGTADGFGSPAAIVASLSGIAAATLVIFAVMSRGGMSSGRAARLNAGVVGFSVALMAVLQVRLFIDQQGLSDASQARLSTATVVWIVALPLVVAVGTALLGRPTPAATGEKLPSPTSLDVPTRGTVAWFRTETMNAWVQVVMYIVIAGSILLCLGSGVPLWSLLLLIICLGVAIASSSSWRLRIDADGFSYSSPLGIPRKSVPLSEISHVQIVHIQPGNWGGWGWRINGSGTGLITGSGTGFRITRTNRKVIEVTCNDATNAVATLEHHGVPVG
ncbi:DUF1648 domain-containing protein [Corynebacterium sp. AOP40-9SA-29]|uniref:DUF1648 domain-containing protein n=1 Tax=Corynebacterium sp. AOP40-9SA-29 TaxID=3457677 RepID=UPI004034BFB4